MGATEQDILPFLAWGSGRKATRLWLRRWVEENESWDEWTRRVLVYKGVDSSATAMVTETESFRERETVYKDRWRDRWSVLRETDLEGEGERKMMRKRGGSVCWKRIIWNFRMRPCKWHLSTLPHPQKSLSLFSFRFRLCGKWKLPCEKRRKTFSFSFFQGLFLVNNNSKLPQTKVLALLPCGWLPRKITSVCDQNIYAAPRLVSSSARWFEFLVKVMSSYKI